MAVDAATPATGMTDESGETPTADVESAPISPEGVEDYDVATDDVATDVGDEATRDDGEVPASIRRTPSPLQLAFAAGMVAVVALGALSGWLGYQAHGAQQMKAERELYLQVAKQGALNLTTIDYRQADADIQRILDSATGSFRDEFAQNSQPFVDVVKQSQSTSQGTISEAGLESINGDEAQAIVAVSVKTSAVGAPEQQPRSWRMRVTVQKSGDDVKISKVGFVA